MKSGMCIPVWTVVERFCVTDGSAGLCTSQSSWARHLIAIELSTAAPMGFMSPLFMKFH
jgi:hypothetical protein